VSEATKSAETSAIDPRLEPLVRFMEERIPFNTHLGMRVDVLRHGECVLRIPFADFLIGDPLRPAIHGGVISTLADTAGGAACFSMLESPNDRVSTVDMRVDYLRPGPPSEDLSCRAVVLRMGNKVAATQMDVFAGKVPAAGNEGAIASGRGVYNILRRSE
jgi:uncharacterized protein (TIGR00369 family)